MSERWRMLAGAAAYRITEIPLHSGVTAAANDSRESSSGTGTNDHGRGQRAAALAAAYHAGLATGDGVIGFGWVRQHPGGPVHVVAVGDSLAGSPLGTAAIDGGAEGTGSALDAGDELLLALPGGARARRLPGLTGLLDAIPAWREVAGISDGLLAEEQRSGVSLDDMLLGSWVAAFGWMVVAQPLPTEDLRTLADDTAARLHLIEGTADRFPGRAVDARRLKHRLAELRRGFSTGMWRVRLLTGGADAASAARIAGLLCASVDLGGLPYALAPGPRAEAEELVAATELVAALACPPRAEVPGVRLALRPEFDTTPENTEAHAVVIGHILDRNRRPAGTLGIADGSLNRHVFVTGATGSGKSHTIKSLLTQTTIPWLVIEPVKAEYRSIAEIRIRPGEPDGIPAGINPLEPAPGFPLQTHADLTRGLFVNSFRSEEPFPQVLSAALTRAYTNAGWDLALGEPLGRTARYPTLEDLQREAEDVVAEIGYSQRVTDDVLGFMKVRLASLRHGTTGRFLAGGHPIDFGKLLTSNVVLEIEDVGDDRDKAFLMGTVLIRLAEHLRGQPSTRLRHLTVIEEAHRLLRKPRDDGATAHAVEMFASLLSELRAYGESLIIADQIPAKLIPDVIKNTAVKITHRLPAADDRDAVGATMNLTDAQSRYLVTLAPGEAAVFSDGMDHPILVKMPSSEGRVPNRTTSPVRIVGRRSPTCGPDCAARPCTLREMRVARRTLDELPVLSLWTELAVLAHLAGWPMPVPRDPIGTDLPARLRDCLISQAVDESIGARNAGTDLAEHVVAAIRARLTRDRWLCQPDEQGWRREPVDKLTSFGATRPSAVERAVGALRTEPEFGERLARALESFTDCRWPLDYLMLGRRRGREAEVRATVLDRGRVTDSDRGGGRAADGRFHRHRVAGLHRADPRGLSVHVRGTADRVGGRVAVGALDRDRRRADGGHRAALDVDGLVGPVGFADDDLTMLHVAADPESAEAEPESPAVSLPRPERGGGRGGAGGRGRRECRGCWGGGGVVGGGVGDAPASGQRDHRDSG
jgi:uncharacterized protein